MERADVIIVGGGPAGAAAAWKLARAGARVTVVDRVAFPRAKPCAGWVTPLVFESLASDARRYARAALLEPVTAFAIGMLGGRLRLTPFAATVSYALRRAEFDHWLLRRSGARLDVAPGGADIVRGPSSWVVAGRWEAPLLLGAGGHFCPVARLLGASAPAESPVAARVAEFSMRPEEARACRAVAGCPELYFFPGLDGYAWCVRKGDWLNVGLGWLGGGRREAEEDAFLDALRRTGRLGPSRRLEFAGHAYLLRSRSLRPAGGPGVMLAGDAAGLAAESSGEGIGPAIESGLLAAQAMLDARLQPARLRVDDYARALARRFGPAGQDCAAHPATWLERQAARCAVTGPRFLRRSFLERRFLHHCA